MLIAPESQLIIVKRKRLRKSSPVLVCFLAARRLGMASKFHRASSAVEGRNGYLSHRHHAARGFWSNHLQVLTVIHNFDLKRSDGTTAGSSAIWQTIPEPIQLGDGANG